MLRVFLRVSQVSLHIREPVLVQINIRKQDKTITMPSQFPMLNGRSQVNASFQFHISDKNPVFQICIVLCINEKKKLAGWKEVDLRKVNKQHTVHIEDALVNCPDKNSIIKFQLTYTVSSFNFLSIELISEQEIHQMNTMLQLSEIQQQRVIVQGKNRQLQKEYKKLVEQNRSLYKQIQQIEQEEQTTQNLFKQELSIQENRQNQCLTKLQRQKYKMAQILDLVLQSGDSTLIDIIQQQIQQLDSTNYQ